MSCRLVEPLHDSMLDFDVLAGDTYANVRDGVAPGVNRVLTATRIGATHQAGVLLSGSGSCRQLRKYVLSFPTERMVDDPRQLGVALRLRVVAQLQTIPTDVGAGLVQVCQLVSASPGYAGGHLTSDYDDVGMVGAAGAVPYSDYTPELSDLAAGSYLTFTLNGLALAELHSAWLAGEAFSCAVVLYGNVGSGVGPDYFDREDYLTIASMDHNVAAWRPRLQVGGSVFIRQSDLGVAAHGAAAASTVAMPDGWQVGDLAIVVAANLGSGLNIDSSLFPSGWISLGQLRGHWVAAAKLLEAGDSTIGVWTGADKVQVTVDGGVQREGDGGVADMPAIGQMQARYDAGVSTGALQVSDGSSWGVFVGMSESDAGYKGKAPAGYTSRSDSHAVGELSAADSNGGVSSSQGTNSLLGGGTQYLMVIEVLAGCLEEAEVDEVATPRDGRWTGVFELPDDGDPRPSLRNIDLRGLTR